MTSNRKLAEMSNKLQIDQAGILHCKVLMSFRENDEDYFQWVQAMVRADDICYANKRPKDGEGIVVNLMSEAAIIIKADLEDFYAVWHNYLDTVNNFRLN